MTAYLKVTAEKLHVVIEVLADCDVQWSLDDETWYTLLSGACPGQLLFDWSFREGSRRGYRAMDRRWGTTRTYWLGETS